MNIENYPPASMTYTTFASLQTRQFGREISNVPRGEEVFAFKGLIRPDQKPQSLPTFPTTKQIEPFIQHSADDVHGYSVYPASQEAYHKQNETWMEEETLMIKGMDVLLSTPPPLASPQNVDIYADEIFEYLRHKEFTQKQLNANYMSQQKEITSQMRSMLIDWIIDVHQNFKMVSETLFLTVNLIDRYLSLHQTTRTKLQLVGVAALFIASKYEEIYAPDLKDFVYVCDRAYTKEEILDMESKILLTVQFDLTQTSSLRFLERLLSGANICERVGWSAKMILEIQLVDYCALRYPPSLLATSALLCALELFDSQYSVPNQMLFDHHPENIRCCVLEMFILTQVNLQSKNTAIKRKYCQEKYSSVAEMAYCTLQQKAIMR